LQKIPFSNPTFFDCFENWHNESFKQKTDNYILVGPKSLPKKKTAGSPTFPFSIILSLMTQRVFIVETCAWVRCKGNLLSEI
jgi:hypothetical protein